MGIFSRKNFDYLCPICCWDNSWLNDQILHSNGRLFFEQELRELESNKPHDAVFVCHGALFIQDIAPEKRDSCFSGSRITNIPAALVHHPLVHNHPRCWGCRSWIGSMKTTVVDDVWNRGNNSVWSRVHGEFRWVFRGISMVPMCLSCSKGRQVSSWNWGVNTPGNDTHDPEPDYDEYED